MERIPEPENTPEGPAYEAVCWSAPTTRSSTRAPASTSPRWSAAAAFWAWSAWEQVR